MDIRMKLKLANNNRTQSALNYTPFFSATELSVKSLSEQLVSFLWPAP
jgi:hypothetical protein